MPCCCTDTRNALRLGILTIVTKNSFLARFTSKTWTSRCTYCVVYTAVHKFHATFFLRTHWYLLSYLRILSHFRPLNNMRSEAAFALHSVLLGSTPLRSLMLEFMSVSNVFTKQRRRRTEVTETTTTRWKHWMRNAYWKRTHSKQLLKIWLLGGYVEIYICIHLIKISLSTTTLVLVWLSSPYFYSYLNTYVVPFIEGCLQYILNNPIRFKYELASSNFHVSHHSVYECCSTLIPLVKQEQFKWTVNLFSAVAGQQTTI